MDKPETAAALDHVDFTVVGIGASAGGLKGLLQFFERMPPESGMAFVIILHLSPKHESNLDKLLQAVTAMPVMQVNESVEIERNHVYVISPAKHLSMVDGMLQVSAPPSQRDRHTAIDLFFRTLGETKKARAMCIVLSGTGSDGTVGLKSHQGGRRHHPRAGCPTKRNTTGCRATPSARAWSISCCRRRHAAEADEPQRERRS